MYYIGIDLGGTNIAAGVVDESGELILKDRIPTLRGRSYHQIVKDMAILARRIMNDAGMNETEIAAIGIGCPGITDSPTGIIINSSNLDFRMTPIRGEIQRYINLPVFLDNDANCAALAESVAGAAKGSAISVTITLGTGVGAGIIIHDKVYRGFNRAASELGHTVIIADGEPCSCGRKGCWEAYASAGALVRQARIAAQQNRHSLIHRRIAGDLSKIDAEIVFEIAKAGDETFRQVVYQYCKYVAIGLVNIINALQPEVLVIGGGVSQAGDYLLNSLRELVDSETLSEDILQTQIKQAKLGNEAGIIGAAMICRGGE